MAQGFNLTAQLNLRGPTNTRQVVADIRRQLGSINANVNVAINAATTRNINQINGQLNVLNRTLQTTSDNARTASTNINNLVRSINGISAAARNIGNSLNTLNTLPRNINNARNAINNLNNNLNNTNRAARQAASEFEEFGRQSALAIRRFAAFSLAAGSFYKLSNAIASSAKEFVAFDKELIRVSQVTGTSVNNLGSLTKQITELSTTLGVSSQSLIQVSSTLAQAGLSATETERALKALALSSLAPSFDSMNDTVEGSIALMRQFGISAGQLEQALGSVNSVAAKFAVEASDIIAAIQRTGGVFATASRGVSEGTQALNEFISVFTSIRATTRESAETIATGLRTIFTRIQRQDTIDALKALGIELRNVDGQFVGAFEAVRRLSQGLSKIDPRSREFAAISEELGGFRQIGKVIPLIQQFAVAQKALAAAQQGQTSLTEDAAVAQGSLAVQFTKVREEFNALIRSVGESDSFKQMIKLALDLASAMIRVADSLKTVLPALLAITAVRGVSALTQFGRGFAGGLRRQNNGGPVRGFARGGVVPGQGSGDTVPAMLEPGEFVIRKKAVETLGVNRLHQMNRRSGGGYIQKFENGGMAERKINAAMGDGVNAPRRFGLVGLRSGLSDKDSLPTALQKPFKTPKKRDVQLSIGTLSNSYKEGLDDQIESNLYQSFSSSVLAVSGMLAKKLKANTSPNKAKIDKVLKGSGFTTVVGAALESALGLIGSPYMDKTESTKALDFPLGLGQSAPLFGIPANIPTDVTRTVGGFGKGSTQMLSQIDRFIDATETGEFTKAIKDKIRNKRAGGLSPLLSTIKNNLGQKSVKDIMGGPAAIALIKKYGLKRGGLNKQSLESTVESLPAGQQRKFLEELQASTMQVQARASGGSIEDTVPALLTPGEFVINKKAASRIGGAQLHRLNKADKIQGFNRGGSIGHIQRFADGETVKRGPLGGVRMAGGQSANFANLGESTNKAVYALAKQLKDGGMALGDALKEARNRIEKNLSQRTAPLPSEQQAQTERTQRRAAAKGVVLSDTLGTTKFGSVTPTKGSQKSFDAKATAITASAQASKQTRTASNPGNQTQMSRAGQQFAMQISGAKTPLQQFGQSLTQLTRSFSSVGSATATLGQAAKMAGSGLSGMAKNVGGRLGGAISRVGGGALNAIGLGSGSSQSAARQNGGGMGGMGAMALAMGGGLAVEGISNLAGGQNTEAGRNISAIGGNVLNMGATGAAIGGMFGPVGSVIGGAVGAVAGFVVGLNEAKAAAEAAAQADREKAAAAAMTTSGKALDQFVQSGKQSDAVAFTRSFSESSASESVAGSGIRRKKAGFFSSLVGGTDETTADVGKRRAETQKAGAEQAEKYLGAQMMATGKTFEELKNSTDPATFKMMTRNIAEADEKFAAYQVSVAEQVQELRDNNQYEAAARVQAEANAKMDAMALSISKRALAEEEAATKAKKAAAASASMAAAVERAAMSFKDSFDIMSQALNRSSFEIENTLSGMNQTITGQASLGGEGRQRTANILANPQAYSEADRGRALRQGASVLGSQAETAVRMAEFGPETRNMALAAAANTQASMPAGRDANIAIGNDVKNVLIKQIEATFGKGSPMAETAIKNVEDKIDKAVNEAGSETLDVNSLVEGAVGPLMSVSEQAAKVIQQANQTVADNLMALGKVAMAIVDLEEKRLSRTSALVGMQAQSRLQEQEALGIKVSPAEKMRARQAESVSRLGLAPGSNVDATTISARRIQLEQQQGSLQREIAARESRAGTGRGGPERELLQLKTRLEGVNRQLKITDEELEKLPQTLEQGIADVMSEMQARVAQLDAQKEARAGFGEKLLTSTPRELADMNQTYSLLSKLMNGQTETIRDSRDAQIAYMTALQQGKTAQEAASEAQSAYADRNRKAIDMLKELSAIEGIDTREMDLARADLMEGMARSTGQINNPFIQKAIEALRTSPEERAASDPVLIALKSQAEALRTEQVRAVKQANDQDRQAQAALLKETADPLIKAMQNVGDVVAQALNNFARATGMPAPKVRREKQMGGMIYAAQGQLINFEPKGTDTVPAMLTPGEFVVNRKATSKNLGLLKQINSGNYAEGGQVAGSTTLGKIAQDSQQRAQARFDTKFYNKLDNVHKEASQTVSNTNNNLHMHHILDILDNRTSRMLWLVKDLSAIILKEFAKNNAFPGMNPVDRLKIDQKGDIALPMILDQLSSGGMVYASKGQFIPKGTDTVPAMLTGGEFVVNSKATAKNRAALESMNRGGVVYAQNGMEMPPLSDIGRDFGTLPSREDVLARNSSTNAKRQNYLSGKERARKAYEEKQQQKRTAYTNKKFEQQFKLMDPEQRKKYWQDNQQRAIQGYSNGGVVQYFEDGGQAPTPRQPARNPVRNPPPRTSNDTLLLRMLRPYTQAAEQEGLNSIMDRWPVVSARNPYQPVNILGQVDLGVSSTSTIKGLKDNTYLNVVANSQQQARTAAAEAFPDLKNQGYDVIHSSQLINNMKKKDVQLSSGNPTLQLEQYPLMLEDAFISEMERWSSAFGPQAFTDQNEFDKVDVPGLDLVEKYLKNRGMWDRVYQDSSVSVARSPVALARFKYLAQILNNINNTSLVSSAHNKIREHKRLATEEAKIQPFGGIATVNLNNTGKVGLVNMNNIPPQLAEIQKIGLQQLVNRYIEDATEWKNAQPAAAISTGGIVYASKGQLINFEPKGTDTVPAMLTPGEFVINRKATQKHLPLLRQINSNQYQTGGDVTVNGPGKAKVDRTSQNIVVNINMDPAKMFGNGNSEGVFNTDAINGFTTKFDNFIKSLNALNLPTQFTHNHNVNITFNGSEILGELAKENGPIAKMVVRTVSTEIDKVKADLRRNTEGAL
jgi:TP901 family phage tail tape measure protein